MYRITITTICCLFIFGTFAATASAAATATWAPTGATGEPFSPQTLDGSSDGDEISRGSHTSTLGLSFMRASTNPTWVVDVMRELIPWSLGGRAVVSSSVTKRTVFMARHRGGASAHIRGRTETSVHAGSLDDYSDRWSGWRSIGPKVDVSGRHDASEFELVDAAPGLDRHHPEYGRSDPSSPEPHDDRADDRYYDAR